MKIKKNRRLYILALALLASQLLLPIFTPKAHAGTLSKTLVRFDRMIQSTGGVGDVFTTGTVCLAASAGGAGTEAFVKVTFPTGMTVNGTTSNWSTNTTSTNMAWPSGASAIPTSAGTSGFVGNASANAASGQDVTWKINDLPDTGLYCFNWTNSSNALKTNTATGNNQQGTVTTQNSGPTTIDSNTFQTSTIANDQITVTASVGATFTFTLSGTADSLGALSTGAVTTSPTPRTITINSSANNGWFVWGKDSNQGLNSSSASYTLASNCSSGAGSNSTLSAGTEGYNLGLTFSQVGGSGTITIAAPFVGNATGKGGGLCSGNLQTLATSDGTADTAVLTIKNNAAINGATRAASDYTDLQTYVGAGMF